MTPPSPGAALYDFAAQLYPICRSITGNGVRETLDLIGRRIELKRHEIPSGTKVFDWEVPLEWNIDDAYVLDAHDRKVVDFSAHNLHILNYSEPAQVSSAACGVAAETALAAGLSRLDSVSHELLPAAMGLLHEAPRSRRFATGTISSPDRQQACCRVH